MRRHGCASKLHLQRVVKSSVTAEPVYPRIDIPYSGKIWRGLKFGDLASSLKLVKFNSSPNFPPFNTLLAAATIPGCSVSYGTAQVQRLFARREGLNMLPRTALQGPQNTSLTRLAKLLMNRPHEDLKANIY